MKTPLTIKDAQIIPIPVEDVIAGYLIEQGLIYRVRPVNLGYMLDVPGLSAVFVSEGDSVLVYAQVSPAWVKAIADAIDADAAAYKTSVRTGVWP